MSVIDEFRQRRRLLENLRPTTATARLGEMWNFLNKTAETKKIINSFPSVDNLIKAKKAKDAKTHEEIAGVGLYILKKCNEGEHITRIVGDLDIGVKQPKPSQQSYTNDAGEFVNVALDFIEDKLKELVQEEQKDNLKHDGGAYGGENDVEVIIEEAREAFGNSEIDRAIELCNKALSIKPNDIKAMDILGISYSRSGKYDEAIKLFDAIIQKEPNNHSILQEKGIALLNKRDYDSAYKIFDDLTRLEPDSNIPWYSKGEILFHRNSFDEAINCFDKAIERNPHDSSAWGMKARALSKKEDYENAINCLDEALKSGVNKSYILLEKGIVYREMGRKDEEIYCYDQAIENDPKYIQTYMQKAHVLQQDEKHEEAIECLRKGIENDLKLEKEAILWHSLASAYIGANNYQEAYKSIDTSLKLHDSEHARQIKDVIEKEMSHRKRINIPNVSDEDEVKREELINAFNYFLKDKKGFPENVIARDRIIDVEMPRPDIALIDPESNKVLALVEFSTMPQSLDRLKEIAKEYFPIVTSTNLIKIYFVEAAEMNSDEEFNIFEIEDDAAPSKISYEDFPTYNQLLFASPLSDPGRRIYKALIKLAKNKYGFSVHAPCRDYINLQIKENKRTAAQIHRLKDSDKNIALVLAGYQEDFDSDFTFDFLSKGDIENLSGYSNKYPSERNWLEGKLGHQYLRYKAGVCILKPGVLVLEDIEEEIGRLLELAKKNAEGEKEPEAKKVSKYGRGGIATIQMDRLSDVDLLGRERLVRAFAGMFVHTEEVEGFTVALLGDWGEGKSTVMKLLRKSLNEKHPGRFDFATFNAWEYEHTDNIAAGLAQEVVNGLIEPLQEQFWERQKLRFKFALKEYKGELCHLAIYSLVAILIILISHVFFKNNTLKGLGLAGGIAALIFLLFKSLPTIIEHPIAIKLETYLKLPNYRKHLGDIPIIQSHLKTLCSLRLVDNKKLIVFVDDLDRCQTDCIARVLDAIRLVMSIPNVIVMIGIDYRIAFKAMENYYKELGDKVRDKSEIARDYLGKIIQLPVRLIRSSPAEMQQYIEKRLFPDAIVAEIAEKEPLTGVTTGGDSEGIGLDREETMAESIEKEGDMIKPVETAEPKSVEEILKDTTIERDMFSDLAQRFNFTNPRQLLRLRNSYRFLKVMDSEEKYDREILMKILFWQEFLNNWPSIIRDQYEKSVKEQESLAKIEKPEAKQIVQGVQEDILKIIKMPMYGEIESFVRIVVLPHSGEGVLDTRGEIEE